MPKVNIDNIVMLSTEELIPYENNAKKHPEQQIEEIAKSIDSFGFADPVGIWHNENGEPEIVTGHGSVLAAKKRGIDKVPCVILDEMTDEERRQFCHIHNITTLSSDIDYDIFKLDFNSLGMDFNDWEEYGYDGPELYDEDDVEEVEPPSEIEEPKVKKGDIWQLGKHRLMCGDSTNADDIAKLMDGAQADLLLTDPPYNVDYEGKTKDKLKINNDAFDCDNSFELFLTDAFKAAFSHLRRGASFYIWYADKMQDRFLNACSNTKLQIKQILIWNKNTLVLGRQNYQQKHEPCLYGWLDGGLHYFTQSRCETTVIEDTKPIEKMTKEELIQLIHHYQDKPTTVIDCEKPTASREHPTMKPIKLMAYQIRNSTKPGWLVLDIFGGSGSTLMAAEQTGRICYTMELDEHYCDVIINRWEEFTGQKAIKVG